MTDRTAEREIAGPKNAGRKNSQFVGKIRQRTCDRQSALLRVRLSTDVWLRLGNNKTTVTIKC